jgi:hypothetical protein
MASWRSNSSTRKRASELAPHRLFDASRNVLVVMASDGVHYQYRAAWTSPEKAVVEVQRLLPSGWRAVLTKRHPTLAALTKINLSPNSVCPLTKRLEVARTCFGPPQPSTVIAEISAVAEAVSKRVNSAKADADDATLIERRSATFNFRRRPDAGRARLAIPASQRDQLVVSRDLARQDAEFVGGPTTYEHLDRRQHFLAVAPSPSPLG